MRRFALLVVGLALLAGVAAGVSGGSTQAKTRWVITDLGTLGGKWSSAVAINGHGQVVGNDGWDEGRAFLWDNGKMQALGTLGGGSSTAVAINESGQVVGWSDTKGGKGHAFLWQNGRMRDLGTMGRDSSAAVAINDRGQVVGWTSEDAGERTRAFVWEKGKMRDLGVKSPVEVVAINNRGEVLVNRGWWEAERALLWHAGKLRSLGSLGGKSSAARAINGRGQVVGDAATGTRSKSIPSAISHAFLWQSGKLRDLGTLTEGEESRAVAINGRGQVVGLAWPAAFLWQRGKMIAFGGRDTEPLAIDGRGRVAGYRSTGECDNPGRHDEIPQAFVWANGRMTMLPRLPGGNASSPGPGPGELFTAYAQGALTGTVNDRGQIVGWSSVGKGDYCFDQPMHAVLWTLKRGS